MKSEMQVLESIKNYYGRVLKTNRDLKTGACFSGDSFAPPVREILRRAGYAV